LLIDTLVPTGPVVIGLDDTLERRWGAKIKARGIYRDALRTDTSSKPAVSDGYRSCCCRRSHAPGASGLCRF